MTQPNQAKKARNRLLAALAGQQQQIADLQRRNEVLVHAVQGLVTAAGVQTNPRFASLMRLAEDEAPDTTTEQAKKPQATDDPENVGASPAPANEDVTPDAVTDVMSTDVALPEDQPLDNLQDVTKPTAGTDAVDPDAVFEGDVKVGNPNNDVQDPPGSSGWNSTPGSTNRQSSKEDPQERFVASLRLARLQIQAGLESGEDLTVAQKIYDSAQPMSEITTVAKTLQAVAVQQQPTRRTQAHRGLVPQPSQQRRSPSFQSTPGITPHMASSQDRGDDEFLFGADGDMNLPD